MGTPAVITLAGICAIGLIGVLGRKKAGDLSGWSVGGGRLGGATMWFLQAGEMFTVFSFLGMAGLGFSAGTAALYALLYIPLGYVGLYFVGPRLWRICRRHGYLTQADFIGGFFSSRALGRVVAVLAVVFVLPYLQLQITGLGLAVQVVTGGRISSTEAVLLAFAVTVVFVAWSGIRGVAATSYVKDALLIVVLVVLAVVVPDRVAGGVGPLFRRLHAVHPALLGVHAGPHDALWFTCSLLASAIGISCMTLPHMWPELLAARSEATLRRNYVFLPAYSLVLALPMVVGLAATLVLRSGGSASDSNSALLVLAGRVMPGWLLGVVAVAVVATAMVPAGGILIGMASLVARNVVPSRDERRQFTVSRIALVVIAALATVLALARPDLIANLLLLTYSGLDQLVPCVVIALIGRRFTTWRPVLAGLLAGVATVIVLTPPFGPVGTGRVETGLPALAVNLAVLGIGIVVERLMGARTATPRPLGAGAAAQRRDTAVAAAPANGSTGVEPLRTYRRRHANGTD